MEMHFYLENHLPRSATLVSRHPVDFPVDELGPANVFSTTVFITEPEEFTEVWYHVDSEWCFITSVWRERRRSMYINADGMDQVNYHEHILRLLAHRRIAVVFEFRQNGYLSAKQAIKQAIKLAKADLDVTERARRLAQRIWTP